MYYIICINRRVLRIDVEDMKPVNTRIIGETSIKDDTSHIALLFFNILITENDFDIYEVKDLKS